MNDLGRWLQDTLDERNLTQSQAAVYARVGQATLSDIINKGHVPKVETLFRLADFFGVSRERVLRLAGHLPPAGSHATDEEQDDALVRALLAEFRKVPDEWKAVAVEQVAQFRRLADLRPVRIIGDEADEGEEEEEERHAQAPDRRGSHAA